MRRGFGTETFSKTSFCALLIALSPVWFFAYSLTLRWALTRFASKDISLNPSSDLNLDRLTYDIPKSKDFPVLVVDEGGVSSENDYGQRRFLRLHVGGR